MDIQKDKQGNGGTERQRDGRIGKIVTERDRPD